MPARRRWPRTESGRYKCTHCEKTYAKHTGANLHFKMKHSDTVVQQKLFPNLPSRCANTKCGEAKYGDFHLCQEHLEWHESKALAYCNRMHEVDENDCWLFQGATNQQGYPLCHSYNLIAGKPEHIVGAYKLRLYLHNRLDAKHDLHLIPISEYGDVHHSCKTKNCINPSHLTEMSESVHKLLHNLHQERIAKSILDEFIEHYPHLENEIISLKKKL